MDIISTKELLLDAKKNKYGIPAFNVYNLETINSVLEGVAEMNSAVIIATTPGTVEYAGMENLVAIMKASAKKHNIDIALHLDHCPDIEFVKECIDAGYKSVMIDASLEDFEENIRMTKEVVKYAHKNGATVEAELGRVGGTEDSRVVSEEDSMLTDPEKALEFVKRTGVDSLAVAIGTAHGVYKLEPKLDFERLKKMNEIIDVPLVLHGGSGVPAASVIKAIENGICKVNIATEIKVPFAAAIRDYFIENPEANDPRKYFETAKKVATDVVIEKIKTCGSENRA